MTVIIVVIVVDTKIAKSVEFGDKLASVCLESSGMAYKYHK